MVANVTACLNLPGLDMKKGISVQLFTALSIVCLSAILGSVLAWQNYRTVTNIMLTATAETVRHLSQGLYERRRWLIDPPRNLLQLLTHSPIMQARTLAQRIEQLPVFVDSLNISEMVSALYVGYPNGEFILVRKLYSQQAINHFSAPEDSRYMMQSVTLLSDGRFKGEWRYYDQQLKLLQALPKDDYQFDPRTRPWFEHAIKQDASGVSSPYVFHSTGQLGYTMSRQSASGQAVIGLDISLRALSHQLQSLVVTESTQVALIDRDGTVIARPDPATGHVPHPAGDVTLPHISHLDAAALLHIFQAPPPGDEPKQYRVNGRTWYGMQAPMVSFDGKDSRVAIAVPASELLRDAHQVFLRELIWIAAISLLLLAMGWAASKRISRPLRALADQVRARSGFDFSSKVEVQSFITEIRELDDVLSNMSRTINDFQAIALALNRGTQLDTMLEAVVQKLVDAFNVEGGAVYLVQNDTNRLALAANTSNTPFPASMVLDTGDDDLVKHLAQALGDAHEYLYVPLKNHKRTLQGVLVLQLKIDQHYSGETERRFKRFVHEVSNAAAVAIETRQLIESQRRLLDGMIKLLANAIDAKSPYTGGHCERVPVLADSLINHVIDTDDGPYADFSMDEAQLYEFRLAAWLHDCGKIATPETVLDKATKLETQYNRIHEIRTRFEVLWRDAEIAYWQGLAQGGDTEALGHTLQRRQAQLQSEFAFIANANIGRESMESDDIDRLKQIGSQRWWRHFDNRLGLASHEKSRLDASAPTLSAQGLSAQELPSQELPAQDLLAQGLPSQGLPSQELPVQEYLLADRPDHIVPWGERTPAVSKNDPDNIWGFDMTAPDHAYNHGELYNLGIRQGTLTPEERFKINEHIVQTIVMLESLPLPPELKRLPDIAGTHHEKMDGSGYPRGLNHAELGIPERVMMIADIFEALTAFDRPYNTAKTLSESLKIMMTMACTGHIDPDMFRLFLTSGIYQQYGEQYLMPSQLDDVDVQAILDRMDQAVS